MNHPYVRASEFAFSAVLTVVGISAALLQHAFGTPAMIVLASACIIVGLLDRAFEEITPDLFGVPGALLAEATAVALHIAALGLLFGATFNAMLRTPALASTLFAIALGLLIVLVAFAQANVRRVRQEHGASWNVVALNHLSLGTGVAAIAGTAAPAIAVCLASVGALGFLMLALGHRRDRAAHT